jgi:hypothetical protein
MIEFFVVIGVLYAIVAAASAMYFDTITNFRLGAIRSAVIGIVWPMALTAHVLYVMSRWVVYRVTR